jgi:hypothetical protein
VESYIFQHVQECFVYLSSKIHEVFSSCIYEFKDNSSEVETNMHVKLGVYLVGSPPIVYFELWMLFCAFGKVGDIGGLKASKQLTLEDLCAPNLGGGHKNFKGIHLPSCWFLILYLQFSSFI